MILTSRLANLLSQEVLPDPLVPRCLDILCKLNKDEKDLIRIVVEIIHELRDADSDDEYMVGFPHIFIFCLTNILISESEKRRLNFRHRRYPNAHTYTRPTS